MSVPLFSEPPIDHVSWCSPGQYIVSKLRPKPDLPRLTLNWSLCWPRVVRTYRIGVKREAGGVARGYLHERHTSRRFIGSERAARTIHARSRNHPGGSAERWHRRHAAACHAPYIGAGRRKARSGSLVDSGSA